MKPGTVFPTQRVNMVNGLAKHRSNLIHKLYVRKVYPRRGGFLYMRQARGHSGSDRAPVSFLPLRSRLSAPISVSLYPCFIACYFFFAAPNALAPCVDTSVIRFFVFMVRC